MSPRAICSPPNHPRLFIIRAAHAVLSRLLFAIATDVDIDGSLIFIACHARDQLVHRSGGWLRAKVWPLKGVCKLLRAVILWLLVELPSLHLYNNLHIATNKKGQTRDGQVATTKARPQPRGGIPSGAVAAKWSLAADAGVKKPDSRFRYNPSNPEKSR